MQRKREKKKQFSEKGNTARAMWFIQRSKHYI